MNARKRFHIWLDDGASLCGVHQLSDALANARSLPYVPEFCDQCIAGMDPDERTDVAVYGAALVEGLRRYEDAGS